MNKDFQIQLNEVINRLNTTGNTIPEQRAAFRRGYSFSNESFHIQLLFWDHVWTSSNDYHLQIQAFFFIELTIKKSENVNVIWDTVKHWQEQVTNWALCDCLAKIFTKILEAKPIEVYEQLSTWNGNENPWKRRQSVVSLLYFHSTKKTYQSFEQITRLITPLLQDKEYYVQKGVGWAIRELYSVYPAKAAPFILHHVKELSPIAFTIAIEKMEKVEKDRLKIIRSKK